MLKILSLHYPSLYTIFTLLGTCTQAVQECNSSIYCHGELLHTIQLSRLFRDSKTFVDLHLLSPESKVLESFHTLMTDTDKNPTRKQMMAFLDEYFESKIELHTWYPPDFNPNPPFVNKIKDTKLKQFAIDVIGIWPKLGRKVSPDVEKNPNQYSFIYVPKGFIVPGGRFKELYYWDSYWIIRGLLICNMKKTARGMIENFFHLVNEIGYVPNGSRKYYLGRSQPPFLAWMVSDYFTEIEDQSWLKHNIATLEKELRYWLEKKTITVEINRIQYKLLRYVSDKSAIGPRPESYYEDYVYGKTVPRPHRQKFYTEIKTAAESGWDFSSRWFISSRKNPNFNMTDIRTSQILPVDLNSIFAGALQKMGDLTNKVIGSESANVWWKLAEQWRHAIESVMWDAEDGVWYDYDTERKLRRKHFYLSCAAPLWARAIEPWLATDRVRAFIKYLRFTGALQFPGGVPTSLRHTGEQWDYPNAWPPLQAMLIGGLEKSEYEEANRLAKQLMKIWITANYMGYKKHKKMFEKYTCSNPGEHGIGGEYDVQTGFGWTNGYVLELLQRYGDELEFE